MASILMVHEEKRLERRLVEDRERMKVYITEWKAGESSPCYVEESAVDLLTCLQVAERRGFKFLHRFE